MDSGDLAFIVLSINPVGGMLISIPLALLKLHYPVWLAIVGGASLSYVQVLVVDLAWTLLCKWPTWLRLLERARSPRVEKVMASGGAFWPVFIAAPLIGPWVVMAFMRYASVPQRHVAAPILLSLAVVGCAVSAVCLFVPQWLSVAP